MTTDELAKLTRELKEQFLLARSSHADFDTLKNIGKQYADAMEEWHKKRFPGKKFNKPSVGYLIRAL